MHEDTSQNARKQKQNVSKVNQRADRLAIGVKVKGRAVRDSDHLVVAPPYNFTVGKF